MVKRRWRKASHEEPAWLEREAMLLIGLFTEANPRTRRWVSAVGMGILVVVCLFYWGIRRRPAIPVSERQVAQGGAWYDVRFTDPQFDTGKREHQGGIDTRLVAMMHRARRTLDVAVYDFDLMDVAQAMAAAAGRGVRVRMLTDTDTLDDQLNKAAQAAFAVLRQADIVVLGDRRGAFMHDKFTVVDGEEVETGSWNYTDGDTYRLDNNAIYVASAALAQNYEAEFEQMYAEGRFGRAKTSVAPHPHLVIDGVAVENYFAPQDHVTTRIVAAIAKAKKVIRFMAFSFTSDRIGQAMLAKASLGVRVEGVFEKTSSQTKYSEFAAMKQRGLPVYTDANPYAMHNKVILIDDEVVITGSFNFSRNADKENDENVLIVHDPRLHAIYLQEYDRVMGAASKAAWQRAGKPIGH